MVHSGCLKGGAWNAARRYFGAARRPLGLRRGGNPVSWGLTSSTALCASGARLPQDPPPTLKEAAKRLQTHRDAAHGPAWTQGTRSTGSRAPYNPPQSQQVHRSNGQVPEPPSTGPRRGTSKPRAGTPAPETSPRALGVAEAGRAWGRRGAVQGAGRGLRRGGA